MKFDIYTLLTKGSINPRLKLNKTLHSEILKEISDLDEVHHNWLNAPENYPNYSCKINEGTLEFSFCDGVLKWYFINIYFKMRAKEISKFQRFYKNDKYLRRPPAGKPARRGWCRCCLARCASTRWVVSRASSCRCSRTRTALLDSSPRTKCSPPGRVSPRRRLIR